MVAPEMQINEAIIEIYNILTFVSANFIESFPWAHPFLSLFLTLS